MNLRSGVLLSSCIALVASCGSLETEANTLPQLGADGLAFSVENMDKSVAPGDDFLRYAVGGWLKRVERPEDQSTLWFATILSDRIEQQVATIITDASAGASNAKAGSPMQQVGTLYNAYMDLDAINAAGIAPLQPELDRLAAVEDKRDLAEYLAHYTMITGQFPMIMIEVFSDLRDSGRQAAYFQSGELGLSFGPLYEQPAGSPQKQLYATYITDLLVLGGYDKNNAAKVATSSIAIESVLHEGALSPVLKVDFRNWNNPRTPEQLQAQLPGFPLDVYLSGLGLPPQETLIASDPDMATAFQRVLEQFTIDQIKDYLAFRLLAQFAPILPADFSQPGAKLQAAFTGAKLSIPPRNEAAVAYVQAALAQPLGRLYVEKFYAEDARDRGMDMIRRLQSAFRKRVENNSWLTDVTRKEALRKIDSFYYEFAIPNRWIDYSSVKVTGDLVRDVMNIAHFNVQREMATAGKATDHWPFSSPGHTSPMNVNAAYDASLIGFEVTAGIAQPPLFDRNMDAAVNFCRLGAIIGHEMTHGFDSGGRLFDAKGTMRDWWTPADTARFEVEAAKLVKQANGYEAGPEQFLNGAISVKENMADVGGIAIAYDALMEYLAEHPKENVEIDGFTPAQRCFIAYGQLWGQLTSAEVIPLLLQDNHAPGNYRAYAPLQHLDAFYQAFGIKQGDPMWLPPDQRVDMW